VELVAELDERGLIHDVTDRGALEARLAEGPIAVYYGCDPTADSLHVGNLVGLLVLRRFQERGHHPIALAGGGTGMVGDPSGKSSDRPLLTEAELSRNLEAISEQIQRIVPDATFVDNASWLRTVGLVDFLRDAGKHVTVNQMVAKESVRSRMTSEGGISFTEFTYMVLQAYDYYQLHLHHNCEMQVGGSDQWGNITLGLDFVRKKTGASLHGLTWPLITRSDGRKFGKTEEGTIWLSPARTSPYRFFQYWINIDDRDVGRFLRMLTFVPLDTIRELERSVEEAPERRDAQRVLAREVTALVHGSQAAADAEEASRILFGGDATSADRGVFEALAEEIPTLRVSRDSLADGADPSDLLARAGLVGSKSEARRSLQQGGVYVNGRRLDASASIAPDELLHGSYMLLRRGKQNYALVVAQ
jgi:tyrosyl-tRNA synthetase